MEIALKKWQRVAIIIVMLSIYFFTNVGYINAAPKTIFPLDNIAEATGASINTGSVSRTYYVDANHDQASDENPGTSQDRPLKTIGRAVALALNSKRNGRGVKVIIKPGVYRESITLDGGGGSAPLILEGTSKGDVLIKGSEIYSDWQVSGKYYTHTWNYKWGASPNIYLKDYDLDIKEIVRRREMVFVNGKRLDQVMSKSAVTAGKYYVAENENKIYMIPPAGVDMEKSTVEVPVREDILNLYNMRNVVIRNLTITQGNPKHTGAAATLWQCNNVLIENTEISNNNWFGIGVWGTRNVTFNKATISYNGGGGIQGSDVNNILIKDTKTSNNNWRGNYGQYYDWETSGVKLLFSDTIKFLRVTANNNYASGLWTDSDCRNVIIDNCTVKGNKSPSKSIVAGLYLEGGIGPYRVIGCTITGNRRGINIASSNDIHIIDSVIANNTTSQINVFNNWNQGRSFNGVTSFSRNTRIENTIISANSSNKTTLFDYDWDDNQGYTYWINNGLKTANIYYYHPNASQAFLLKDASTKGSLADWQADTGIDSDAIWLAKPYDGGTPVPAPTPTVKPEPKPTQKPVSTATPAPAPKPTETPTPTPAETSSPTATPDPDESPVPTENPVETQDPTATPDPETESEGTEEPTETAEPAATESVSTQEPAATIGPTEDSESDEAKSADNLPDDGGGSGSGMRQNTGLVAALILILSAAVAAVIYTTRKLRA